MIEGISLKTIYHVNLEVMKKQLIYNVTDLVKVIMSI